MRDNTRAIRKSDANKVTNHAGMPANNNAFPSSEFFCTQSLPCDRYFLTLLSALR
jgi:hypothetical protein